MPWNACRDNSRLRPQASPRHGSLLSGATSFYPAPCHAPAARSRMPLRPPVGREAGLRSRNQRLVEIHQIIGLFGCRTEDWRSRGRAEITLRVRINRREDIDQVLGAGYADNKPVNALSHTLTDATAVGCNDPASTL